MRKMRFLSTVLSVVMTGAFIVTNFDCVVTEATVESESPFVIDENGVLLKYTGSGGDIVIPDGVTSIGDSAFKKSKVKNVKMPDTVTRIEYAAFLGCDNLEEIKIPDNVTYIGSSAFYYCESLKTIQIPDSVSEIGGDVFIATPWLEEKKKENPLVTVNNMLIDGNSCKGDVTVPDNVKSICENAFGNGAKDITSIFIPDNVTNIGRNAFNYCYTLESVILPTGLKCIENSLFHKCNRLKNVTIPYGVESIEAGAFFDCDSLEQIEIPESVVSIGNAAFSKCTNLKNIDISENVSYIGKFAFNNTAWLNNKIKENPLVIVNNMIIDGKECCGEVEIPDGIEMICNGAFFLNEEITSIKIPNSMINIGQNAFYFCQKLASVTLPASVTNIGKYAFECCDNLNYFNVYSGSFAQQYAKENKIPYNLIDVKKDLIYFDLDNVDGVTLVDTQKVLKYALGIEKSEIYYTLEDVLICLKYALGIT